MIICFLTEKGQVLLSIVFYWLYVYFFINRKKLNFKNIIIALIAIFITSPIVYIKFDDLKLDLLIKFLIPKIEI